jgi:elongation factor Ts
MRPAASVIRIEEQAMAVSAQAVMALRQRTGLPMMECKKALTKTDGDVDQAVEQLRKAGSAKAVTKLAGRTANQGKIGTFLSDDRRIGALAAFKCETAPVTKNELFLGFLDDLVKAIVESDPADLDALKALPHGEGTLEDGLKDLINRIRENFQFGKFSRFEADSIVQYVHFDGKKAAMVAFEGAPHSDAIESFGRDLCMHIVFNKPSAMRREDVPTEEAEKEREILLAAMKVDPKNSKKPEEILKKIIEGQMSKKFFATKCLLEQPFIKNDSLTVEKAIAESGLGIKLKSFVYAATDI